MNENKEKIIISICILIIITLFITAVIIEKTKLKDSLKNICKEKGYNEITDYNKLNDKVFQCNVQNTQFFHLLFLHPF